MPEPEPSAAAPVRAWPAALLRRPIALALAAVLVVAAALWVADRVRFVHTSDARIAADMVLVSAEVAGRIDTVDVTVGQRIAAAAPLLRLDDEAARLDVARLAAEVAALEAEIAREAARVHLTRDAGESRVGARRSSLGASTAEIAAARALLVTAEAEHVRIAGLRRSGLAVQPALERAADHLEAARRTLSLAEAGRSQRTAEMREAVAEAGETRLIAAGVDVLALRADALRREHDLAALAQRRHLVASPIRGVVDEIFVDAGEYVAPGARLALLHDPDKVWIKANIKETDIARVRVGGAVQIRFDAAPGRAFAGRISAVRDAASAEFALLPPPNPSGVFTKITQRIPVRVEISPDDTLPPLRPGAMATLKLRADGPR